MIEWLCFGNKVLVEERFILIFMVIENSQKKVASMAEEAFHSNKMFCFISALYSSNTFTIIYTYTLVLLSET